MLASLTLIFLLGLLMASIFKKLKLPDIIGLIFTGILLSPYVFDLLDKKMLSISSDIRQFAIVIILTRTALFLDVKDLKKVGRPAVLMSFLPSIFEILAFMFIAQKVLGVTLLQGAIIGTAVAAVSPVIIVPEMHKFINNKIGNKNSIPQLIMAAAAVEDVFIIVLFNVLTKFDKDIHMLAINSIKIPVSMIVGILVGIIVDIILIKIFQKLHMRDTIKAFIVLSISFLFMECQKRFATIIPMSGLMGIMSMGITLKVRHRELATTLLDKYNKIWMASEIILFVLVGATLNINYAIKIGWIAIGIILFAMLFRMIGVYVSLLKTKLTMKEKVFCILADTPKATVQAAIGGIPLAMGLDCGNLVLTVAVLAVLITAPLGALLISVTYKKLLVNNYY
ncbi:cation:proton antiporter domain-containing protein [Terrisporobacter sp.]